MPIPYSPFYKKKMFDLLRIFMCCDAEYSLIVQAFYFLNVKGTLKTIYKNKKISNDNYLCELRKLEEEYKHIPECIIKITSAKLLESPFNARR